MPVCLVPADKGRTIVLDKTITLIGRHPDCDVVLTRSRKISRKHCCLAQVNSHLVIRDLGSMNGIWVNGERVRGLLRVEVGDQVSIGDLVYQLQDQNTPAKPGSEKRKTHNSGNGATRSPRPPMDLSQEVPVAIPDEDESFVVDPSIVQSGRQSWFPVDDYNPADMVDDNADPDDEAIPLAESREIPLAESREYDNQECNDDANNSDDVLPVADAVDDEDVIPLRDSGDYSVENH